MRRQNAYVANESSIHPRSDFTETENEEWKRRTATGNVHGEQGEGQIFKMGKKPDLTLSLLVTSLPIIFCFPFLVPRISNIPPRPAFPPQII